MKVFAKTDFGKVRQVNQDYFIAENRRVGILPNLFIVADGVGSNKESGFASKHCADFVLNQLSITKEGYNIIEELSKAYRLANTDLYYRIIANPSYKGMGTTMVSATVFNNKLIVCNVGDSRCYHIRNNINQITEDHSMAEELVKEHAIERNSDKYFELKSQLSRAFGASKKLEPDFFQMELMVNDYILLCSDGLSNMVSNEKILEIINQDTNMETKVDNLIKEANENGGRDNIAIILLYIDEINKENSIFEKERAAINSETFKLLNKDEKKDNYKSSIKEIFESRKDMTKDSFRSRKRKEGETDEK